MILFTHNTAFLNALLLKIMKNIIFANNKYEFNLINFFVYNN